MSGRSTSTATGIATAMIHWGIDTSPHRGAAYGTDVRHRTAVAATVHVLNSKQITRTNPHAGDAVFGTQRCQHLHDLAIDLHGHETVAVRIKTGGGPHLVLKTALQRECGRGREAHQEIPHRTDEHLFEDQTTDERGTERQRTAKDASEQHSGSAKADEQAEEHPGRCEAPQPRDRRRARGSAVGMVHRFRTAATMPLPMPMAARVRVSMAAEAGEGHRDIADCPYGEGECIKIHAGA